MGVVDWLDINMWFYKSANFNDDKGKKIYKSIIYHKYETEYNQPSLGNLTKTRVLSIDLVFKTQRDYMLVQFLMQQVCLVENPTISHLYEFIDKIGSGSQAQVDLYKKKVIFTEGVDRETHRQEFKTVLFQK